MFVSWTAQVLFFSFSFSSLFRVMSAVALIGSSLRVVGRCSVRSACPTLTTATDSLEDRSGTVRSQLVPVPSEDGVARLTRGQFLEGALWRIAGHFSHCLLLSWRALSGVWAVVKLSVQFSRVKIQHKLPQFTRNRYVLKLREDIHMSERVNGDDRAVGRSFLDVEQRMTELIAVRMQKVYRSFLTNELSCNFMLKLF